MIKGRTKALVVVALIAFYSAFAVWSIYEYRAYGDKVYQDLKEAGFEGLWKYVDLTPYTGFWYGQVAFVLGIIVLITSLMTLASAFARKPKQKLAANYLIHSSCEEKG